MLSYEAFTFVSANKLGWLKSRNVVEELGIYSKLLPSKFYASLVDELIKIDVFNVMKIVGLSEELYGSIFENMKDKKIEEMAFRMFGGEEMYIELLDEAKGIKEGNLYE